MPAPRTTADFLNLVRKSGLVEFQRLKAFQESVSDNIEFPSVPRRLAERMIREGLITRLQAALLMMGKWKNYFIRDKYKLLEHVGSGGMGQVYLCEHLRMGRRVALKVLPTERAADETSLHRFYREARAIAALDHPNIVRAHDVDRDCSYHFLVMEYVEGTNLQDLVRKSGPLSVGRAVDYTVQAACGLHHAHQHGLIHRDVKPSNLLLERNGQIKLLDLGLARFFTDASDHLTREIGGRNLIGTADFLSPEQAIDSQSADGRSDIYSLGASLYYMLAGHAPFQAGTIAEKLLQHQNERPTPIRHVRKEVPPALSAIVDRCMSKRPDDRFQNCLDVIDALMPLVPGVVPLPEPDEMPKLCLAVRQLDQLSSRTPIPELSSARLQRCLLTAGQTQPQPLSHLLPAPRGRGWHRCALVAACLCLGGILIGLATSKLATLSFANPTVVNVNNHHSDHD